MAYFTKNTPQRKGSSGIISGRDAQAAPDGLPPERLQCLALSTDQLRRQAFSN
jgi:hypothetical protein